ncbi:hypothetical protein LCGC14_1828810, partial [marine sediment metagenome]
HDIYLEKAAAIIQELGGKGSHGASQGKKLGIPAVVGATHALSVLKDGQKIVVDGDNGIVYEYKPGMDIEDISKPTPKPAAALPLAERMAAIVKKTGQPLPPGFLKEMKKQE